MKSAFAAISFILYFAATSGIVINSHFCMKKLVSVHLFENKAKVCGLCGMDIHDNNGCCRDEVKVLKLVQDQVKTPVTIYEIPRVELLPVPVSGFITAPAINAPEQRHFHNHSPPLIAAQAIYLQNNVFRI